MLKHLQSNEEFQQKSLAAKGFTLIELLVVIVILGILAAVVVFAVSGIQNRGQDSACRTDRRTLLTAVEAWNASPRDTPNMTNEWPTSIGDLTNANLIQDDSELYELTGGNAGGTVRPDVTPIAGEACDTP